MRSFLGKIIFLLSHEERCSMMKLMAAILVMAFVDVIGVASIMPFMTVLSSPEVIERNRWLSWLYVHANFSDTNAFLMALGVSVFLLLIFGNAFTVLTTGAMLRVTNLLNYSLSTRLLKGYVARSYIYFVNVNSADLSKNILTEVQQFVNGVILPAIEMVAKLVVSLFMIALLFAVEPLLAFVMILLLGGIYAVLYGFVRRRLTRAGKVRLSANRIRYQVTTELFAGIKELMVLGREAEFTDRYAHISEKHALALSDFQIISRIPRYFLEVLVFGGLLIIVIFFLYFQKGIGGTLPLIALYAMAGYRIMPAMQNVFQSATQIRFYRSVVDTLYADMRACSQNRTGLRLDERLIFERDIVLSNVCFSYPNKSTPVLKGVSVVIPKYRSVAFVGATGSGKTTLVDVILGLLDVQGGSVKIDGRELAGEIIHAWRRCVGYVPQNIFLADDTIERNIALGVESDAIDRNAVVAAARVANLHEFVMSLDGGYETFIGERGVRLSGGQRQRIGIARALYHDPDLLVMDEGTSALDGKTEEAVMQAIDNLAHEKTIILIAHRLTTVRKCDTIYLLDSGRIVADGTYDELIAASEKFRTMARVTEPVAVTDLA